MAKNTNKNATAWALHKAAELFPEMSDADFQALKEDIKVYGQTDPISVVDDKLIDGRHRLCACLALGIEPKVEHYEMSEAEIWSFVMSKNQHRRHLGKGQLAIIAAQAANIEPGGNQYSDGVSQAKAGESFGVSKASVGRAKVVLEHGCDELIHAVKNGAVDVGNAEKLAKYCDHIEQREILTRAANDPSFSKGLNKGFMDIRAAQRVREIEAKSVNNKPLNGSMGKFSIIYADPPWQYLGKNALAYPTMTLQDICDLKVPEITHEDAVLFLWFSASLMSEAVEVVKAWGFEVKTQMVWDKKSAGQGTYFRLQHEHLLLATRGKVPAVRTANRPVSVYQEARGAHSAKPLYFRDMIASMYPDLAKLGMVELFCRGEPGEGWKGWGNECTGERAIHGVEGWNASAWSIHKDAESEPAAANDDGSPRRGPGRPRKQINSIQ